MKVTRVHKRAADFYPDAKMFELSEPFTFDGQTGRHVVLSFGLVSVMGEDNLGLFLADEEGRCLSWSSIADARPQPRLVLRVLRASYQQ